MSTALTKAESQALEIAERVISEGLATFVEVGRALTEVRAARLYRERYETFEQYCRQRWGMSKTHANRLVASVVVSKNLKGVGEPPLSEAQVRPLAGLSKADQRAVWKRVLEDVGTANRVTGNLVTRAVNESRGATAAPKSPGLTGFAKRSVLAAELQTWYDTMLEAGELDLMQPRAIAAALIKVVKG
jgi:hypothetical protein